MIICARSFFNLGLVIFCISITSGCTPNSQSADTILINGKIITMDKEFSVVEAVAIKDGEFLEVGTDQDILSRADDSTLRMDLKGRTVIPGLIEGHAHTFAASQSESFEKIPEIINVKQILGWISAEVKKKKEGEWIVHPKFFFTRLQEMRQLTLALSLIHI